MLTHKIEVKGVVQGVGFRPFVYNLALEHNLKGSVINDDNGVEIYLQGSKLQIDEFLNSLKNSPPSLSQIDKIIIFSYEEKNIFDSFLIKHSQTNNSKTTWVSADVCVCDDCIEDISNPNNFRYNYALTNCTNCGPRYTIIKTVPYDRVNTSMKSFVLCETCKKEYEDPTNRRYHAQPIACATCGPKVKLYDENNTEIESETEAIKKVAQLIKNGEIVALKSLGGFHLVCDATNHDTVKTLRQRKNRPTKPFAVMCKDVEQVKRLANISKKEQEVICSRQRPIVLVKKSDNSKLDALVAPNINRVGLFLPFTPLQYLLFNYLDCPLVATSANLSDEPIIKDKGELYLKLAGIFSYVVDYNRDIINACDDSVVQVVNDKIFYLRKARGYTPSYLKLNKKSSKKILAVGANQKNTMSFCLDDVVITSPHIGDLNSLKSMEFFQNTLNTLKNFYEFEPELIVCDKHPNYETTKWAKIQNLPMVQVQHHYAHVLSCMAQYFLEKEVLAFAFDGTGYGDDGNIWGGEVFIATNKEYKRVHHFEYFKLLGGEMAIKQIKRVGLSLLFESYTLEEILNLDNSCVKAFRQKEIELLYTIWQKGLNAPLSSSAGRLFDAICSLSGLKQDVSYDGESGLLIEQVYNKEVKDFYEYEIVEEKISLNKAIKQIVNEEKQELICTKFINTLYEIIIEISNKYPHLEVVLTGGVFQNKTLLQMVTKKLDILNRKYYYSKEIPLNDGGISLGQIYSQI